MRLSVGFSSLMIAVFASVPAGAQPQPADPSQFVGEWQVGFQATEGVIVNEPSINCNAPAVIEQAGDQMIRVTTPGGGYSTWAVKSFGDNFPWWQDDDIQVTMVAKWVEWDAFVLAGKDASGVQTDWENAKQWTKCEE